MRTQEAKPLQHNDNATLKIVAAQRIPVFFQHRSGRTSKALWPFSLVRSENSLALQRFSPRGAGAESGCAATGLAPRIRAGGSRRKLLQRNGFEWGRIVVLQGFSCPNASERSANAPRTHRRTLLGVTEL